MLKKHLFILVLVLVAVDSGTAEAQNVLADSLRLRGGPCTARAGAGTPEGIVSGVTCDTFEDRTTGQIYKKIGSGTTGWYPVLGPSAATCATFTDCVAAQLTLDTTVFRQLLRTDRSKGLQQSVTDTGAWLESFNGGGWAPLILSGGPVKAVGGGFQIGSTDIVDPGLGNAAVDGYIGKPGYVSQNFGWRIDGLGAADFRYIYTDELHARKFIADLEQALAGLQIIAKSVGQIGAAFTMPAPGSIGTLVMKDLPSAENMAIFESGDYVWVRNFSRAGGSLSITNAYGIVTSYTDLPDKLQSWTFTRLSTNAGAMTVGTVVGVDTIVLDVGLPGNGWVETNAIDGIYGINSPYTQVVTWSGDSPIAANQTLRTRMGNLRGVTGVAGEYGFIAGTYAATGGRYVRASNEAFELHGIDLSLWNGPTRVMRMDPVSLYQSMGSPAPTSFSSGSGCWSGLDAGVFKWRCGDPAGGTQYIEWNGTQLTVAGNIVVTGTSIDASSVNGVAGATVVSGAARGLLGINAAGNPALPAAATPSGSGLFLGSDYMGYYASGAWKTYMTNTGHFYLGGPSGALQWNGTTLTISATLSGNGSSITSISGGNITNDSILTGALAAGAVTAAKIAAGTITATQIAAGTITASQIAAGTITGDRIAAATITATNLSVSSLSAITANLGTVTAGTLTGVTATFGGSGGDVTLNSDGISIASGTGIGNRIKWSDGTYITSNGSNGIGIISSAQVSLDGTQVNMTAGGQTVSLNGSGFFTQGGAASLGTSSVPWLSLYVTNIVAGGETGISTSFSVDDVLCPGSGRRNIFIKAGIIYAAPCQ